MKRLILAAMVAFSAPALAAEPIQSVEHHPIDTNGMSPQRIEATIIEAGQERNWQFKRIAPGQLHASQETRGLGATVQIDFSPTEFSIHLVSSHGMDQEGATIHRNYNRWVKNLEKDIVTRITNAALMAR